jgi:hypothetical protein
VRNPHASVAPLRRRERGAPRASACVVYLASSPPAIAQPSSGENDRRPAAGIESASSGRQARANDRHSRGGVGIRPLAQAECRFEMFATLYEGWIGVSASFTRETTLFCANGWAAAAHLGRSGRPNRRGLELGRGHVGDAERHPLLVAREPGIVCRLCPRNGGGAPTIFWNGRVVGRLHRTHQLAAATDGAPGWARPSC